jgi:hypothetical protein
MLLAAEWHLDVQSINLLKSCVQVFSVWLGCRLLVDVVPMLTADARTALVDCFSRPVNFFWFGRQRC